MPVVTFTDLATRLLALPTAPFHEHHVIAAILEHARRRPGVEVTADAFGNLLLTTGAPGGLCLTAHLDHPALGFARPEAGRDLLFERLGGVPDEFTRDARLRIYTCDAADGRVPAPLATGQISAFLEEGCPDDPAARPAFRVRLDEATAVPPGAFAVWDLPAPRIDGNRLEAGACDDVAGVAVALTVLDRARAAGAPLSILLTRAEETGFGGMLAAIDAGLDAGSAYINIECSSRLAGAPLGEGPVIRVGDRRWIFDAGVTGALEAAAEGLRSEGGDFPVQRLLMSGGVCEATPLARSGRRVGAVALPLDNYHNRGKKGLRAEAIDLRDADGLVSLLTALALREGGGDAAITAATDRLDGMLASRRAQQAPRLLQTLAGLPHTPEMNDP